MKTVRITFRSDLSRQETARTFTGSYRQIVQQAARAARTIASEWGISPRWLTMSIAEVTQ